MKKIWETRPNGNKFVSYIEKNKIQHFRDNMLVIRLEAINSLIKQAKGPGKLSLKETISLLQKEVRGQEENVKFALLGKGKISLPDNI